MLELAAANFEKLLTLEDAINFWWRWTWRGLRHDPAGMVPLVTWPGHDPFRWPVPPPESLWRNVNDGMVYEVLGVLHRSPGGAIDQPLIEYKDEGGPVLPYSFSDHPLWATFPAWYENWEPVDGGGA